MRNILSTYGWIMVIISVLLVLISFASPYGHYYMNSLYGFTNALTAQKNQNLDLDNCLITINNTTDNTINIKGNVMSIKPGSLVELEFDAKNELICNSIKIEYNDNELEINDTKFTMPEYDVIITPIWTTAGFTKIYFDNADSAQVAANAIHDLEFRTSNRNVIIGETTYYVVYDSMSHLGYTGLGARCYNDEHIKRVIVGTGCTSIEPFAFYNATGLEYVFIPSTVLTIGTNAFRNCSSLTNVVFSEGLTSIGHGAFYHCPQLAGEDGTFSTASTVTFIGDYAFSDTGYSSVIFPGELKKLGSYVFYNCANINTAILPTDVWFEYGALITEYEAL